MKCLATSSLAVLLVIASLAGCGGGSSSVKPAQTKTPLPTPTIDKWAIQTCDYLGKQDPGNGYANDLALTMAGMSTTPELVDLVIKANQVGDMNLIRAWCQRNRPQSGVAPREPSPN